MENEPLEKVPNKPFKKRFPKTKKKNGKRG